MNTLILLTNEFPYGSWEPYLETEAEYYTCFDKVIVCALQLRDEHTKRIRHIDTISNVIPVRYVSRVQYFVESIRILGDINFYRELGYLIKKGRFTLPRFISLCVFLSRSHHEAAEIYKKLRHLDLSDSLFYSYRFEYQPYVAIILKRKLGIQAKIVCRAHRYDLYEEQHKENYIPLRRMILEKVDMVYPCSANGRDYLVNCFPERANKILPAFLGTRDFGIGIPSQRNGKYHVVSCSTMVPVKRIELIIHALSRISDYDVTWTHFGDGPLFEEIKNLAIEKLHNNIHFDFRGEVDNSVILNEYKTVPYDLFINVSSSEGIPVSIMEALSFGIPCIATDAGGTNEIIHNSNYGLLLNINFSIDELVSGIRRFCTMNYEDYLMARSEARAYWASKFDAESNYSSFIHNLLLLKNG